MVLTLIAAVARNGVIGADGAIPWHLPDDFAHFRRTTTGHTLVMGRATYDSIGRPLPGRTTIVVSRDPGWSDPAHPQVRAATSVEAALALASAEDGSGQVYVAGGAQVYAAALPLADEQLLTEVPADPVGDTYYPAFSREEWREAERTPHDGFDVVRWVRRPVA